jgi:biopolymer transport protein ExbD
MAGSANIQGDEDELISGINVTPLVDIVLVLLIIFMLLATRIVKEAIQAAMEIDLPRAAHAGETTGTMLTVVLTKEGFLFVDGAQKTEAELKEVVRAAVVKDKDARAVISADKAATHGAVVHVIDVVKGQGLSKFALNIEKEEE